ncbi:MAG: hypothetical protein AAGH45_07070 [Pseudomonadota bacterium]
MTPSLKDWVGLHKVYAELYGASAKTIWYRTPMIWAHVARPSPKHQAEMTRMVTEKMAAAWESYWAVSLEMMRLNAAMLAKASTAVPVAAARPASRRAKANARRLSARARRR